ncbi:MAG: PQQ-dependent sugar dehydrogenase [Gammaproteobacteria bacterium]
MRRILQRLACALVILLPASQAAADSPPVPDLPPVSPSAFRLPKLIGWAPGETPVAPPGFIVERFAGELDRPRWLLPLPNGDVLVSQSRTERLRDMTDEINESLTQMGLLGESPNNIVLLREDGGRVVLLESLNLPHGMEVLDDHLYVATTDALLRYPFRPGQTTIDTPPEKIIDIPAGEQLNPWNNHWTRNVIASPDGKTFYLTVGSGTNANESGQEHPERAAIWELQPDGSGKRLFATGLRNPVGIDFEPTTGELWTTVNERDNLGDDLPPDFMTRVLDGAFYGWPYVYFGTYPDPFHKTSNAAKVRDAQERARVPDLALGGHSVPLGLRFYRGEQFPETYRSGAFVARRGGVGRAEFLGYDVVFVPFEDGSPTGVIEPFLSGFIADGDASTVRGRPVCVVELPDGSLLVSDDAGGVIWRVRYVGG